MSDCERTSLYYDGELDPADEAEALEHLATCEQCQAELGDWVGLDVVLEPAEPTATTKPTGPAKPNATTKPTATTEPRGSRRNRWVPIVVVSTFLAIAATLVFLVTRPTSSPSEAVAPEIALAATRSIEPRLSAEAFDRHRRYDVTRDGAAGEAVPVQTLAELEAAGDLQALAAAHISALDVVRAEAALERAEPSADVASDRAALSVLRKQPEQALQWSDRALELDPQHVPAMWNRALALRDLGLKLRAAQVFEDVAQRGEPGWSDEARERGVALGEQRAAAERALEQFQADAAVMLEGGPVLAGPRIRAFPVLARIYFDAAWRLAESTSRLDALEPVAAELDALFGHRRARAALDRARRHDFDARKPWLSRYRAIAMPVPTERPAADWIEALRAAGPQVRDIYVAAVILAGQTHAHAEAVEAYAEEVDDPWFSLAVAIERGKDLASRGEFERAEALLVKARSSCDERAFGFRCAALDSALAELYFAVGRVGDAAVRARAAIFQYDMSGAFAWSDRMLPLWAEAERHHGRASVARAVFEEVRLRVADASCEASAYASDRLTAIALKAADIEGARRELPPPRPCDRAPDPVHLTLAVELARRSGTDEDRAKARAVLEAATEGSVPPHLHDLAAARLAIDQDPTAADRIEATLQRIRNDPGAPLGAEMTAWGYSTLLSDAGARGDFERVLELGLRQDGIASPSGCLVVASLDDDRLVFAIRGPRGFADGDDQREPIKADEAVMPARLQAELADCERISVVAAPPLHGRPQLLGSQLPWAFVGRSDRVGTGPARSVLVLDPQPPVELARLHSWTPRPPRDPSSSDTVLSGVDATPSRVLAELRDATYVEIHAHGLVDLAVSEASYLALSPDADGSFMLRAADLERARFGAGPVVVLAACETTQMANHLHKRWSLPDAFLLAGAKAVVGAARPVPDNDARRFFEALRGRLLAGEPPATAVAAVRRELSNGDASHWATSVIVFEAAPIATPPAEGT